jgi:hypothetical protein
MPDDEGVHGVSGSDAPRSADQHQDETPAQRLDRNTIELLNELRVAATGIQVLFAFLLVVPFNTGFRRVTSFERDVYFGTLLCVAIAAALLIAPSVHHRLLFRRHERRFLVETGSKMAIAATAFMAVGLTGILLLISDFLFGGAVAATVTAVAAVVIAGLWFGIPLLRRLRHSGKAGRPM